MAYNWPYRKKANREGIMTDGEKRLQQEREKRNRLVDEALANGTPIDRTYAIMDQSRRGDKLLEQMEGGERRRFRRKSIGDGKVPGVDIPDAPLWIAPSGRRPAIRCLTDEGYRN
jgi:hypothetical protein